jgi:2-dehydro-3-deoxygluconokinase
MTRSTEPTLITFGETMGLISTRAIGTLDVARDAAIGIGGAESNVAIGAARLGTRVRWTGRVGNDAIGDLIERSLRAAGVEIRAIRDPHFTGLMIRHQRTSMSVHVDYHRQGSAGSHLRADDGLAREIRSTDVLHLTGITAALSATAREACAAAVQDAHSAGAAVSLDVNFRRKLWSAAEARPVLAELAASSDIVFAGIEEAQILLGSTESNPRVLADHLAQMGPAEVVIKEGARGCTALIGGEHLSEPAVPVTPVDPVGAGDAFVAGYLAERLRGESAPVRLRTAAAMGAYAVTVPGDCELLPTRAELAAAHLVDVIR